jgi:phage baseplate assembly protein W
MNGMDATTGKPIEGEAHLRQSIRDILTTLIGTRIARREYGSWIPALIDQPWNALTRMRLIAATALALMRWEPRVRLTRVAVAPGAEPGAYEMSIEAARLDVTRPTTFNVSVPLRSRPSLVA